MRHISNINKFVINLISVFSNTLTRGPSNLSAKRKIDIIELVDFTCTRYDQNNKDNEVAIQISLLQCKHLSSYKSDDDFMK
jgi:hypothetical protein